MARRYTTWIHPEHIVFTGFRWGGVLLFAASGGIVFAVDSSLITVSACNTVIGKRLSFNHF